LRRENPLLIPRIVKIKTPLLFINNILQTSNCIRQTSNTKFFIASSDKQRRGVNIEEMVVFSSIVMAGLSFLLLLVSAVSYSRIRDLKMLFLTSAFLMFMIKGILLIADIASQSFLLIVFDLVIIVSLYLTVAKR